MNEEDWRAIPGQPGYEITAEGHIRSWRKAPRPHDMKIKIGSNGYPKVTLSVDKYKKTTTVHALILLTFVGPPPNGMIARHRDGDPTNSVLANLVYGTHSENSYDRVTHGRDHRANRTHCPKGHPYDEVNTRVRPGHRDCRTCERAREKLRIRDRRKVKP